MREAQVCLGPAFAGSSYQFNLTGTSTAANVYENGTLTTLFPITGFVAADNFGRFPPIYLDPSIIYQVNFTGPNGYTWQRDPYTPPLATTGTSSNVTYGMNVAPTGEFSVPAPNSGGTGINMTIKAGQLGSAALRISSTLAGQPALIVNTSATTGAQTATFTATNKPGTATSSPAGWLPIQCDGTIYYIPIWHGNNFTPYTPNVGAIGEEINSLTVEFNGNGSTTAFGGGTAIPSSWFLPNQTNVGNGYWINVTKTGGLAGLVFQSSGVPLVGWNNITSSGLAIGVNSEAQITGTYQISSSSSGTPVVASGTIILAGGSGVQENTYNGSANLVLNGNGSTTLGGVATSQWFAPITAGEGANFWIQLIQTSGSAGTSFTGAGSGWTNISSGGLTIGLTGGSGVTTATGTYTIATNSTGTLPVGTGSITLTSGSAVQSNNYSGTTPLVLASTGAATLGGSSAASWYSPNVAGVGSSYWIDITRTGGTAGVNFNAAQGSWTNIGNGLTIGMSGTTGDVGTVTVTGSYGISSSSSGTPVLGSGTISLSVSGLTVIHVYTTAVTSATETIPTGTTTVQCEIWGSGGGGSGGKGGSEPSFGKVGGAGGLAYSSYSASTLGGSGKTFKYTVTVGGAGGAGNGGSGTSGTAGTIVAGTVTSFPTMTGNGGAGATFGAAGSGGTATGGNVSNTTGGSGTGLSGHITGDGSPYGAGGAAGNSSGGGGGQGSAGAAVFYYS
jgi:collagen type VII alpha